MDKHIIGLQIVQLSSFFRRFSLMKYFFIFLLFHFSAVALPIDSLQFYKVDADFSHRNITDIIQDQHGFIWVATRYGLNRFDGERVVSYYSESSSNGKLSNSFINSLVSDDNGNIWIGTYGGGVNVFSEEKGAILEEAVSKEISEALSGKLVTGIIKDKKGKIWVSTEKYGLFNLDPIKGTTRQYLHYADDPGSLSANHLVCLAEDEKENLWIGSWEKGLNLFLRQNQRFISFSTENNQMIPHNTVRSIHSSPKGYVWVGFQEDLRKISYNDGQYTIEKLPVQNPELLRLLEKTAVLSILEDRESRLWIGSENHGLFVVDLKTGAFKQYRKDPFTAFTIGSNSIFSLFQDSFGTIWIGTFDQGLYKVDPYEKNFTHVYQARPKYDLNHHLISSFAEDENGIIYIGTDGGGLNLLHKDGHYQYFTSENSALKGNSILSLQHDFQGNLWVGSWEGGLSILEKGSSEFRNFPSDGDGTGTSGKYIFDLFEDSKKRIWIASFRTGLDVYLPEKDTFYHFSAESVTHKITTNNVHSITEDAEGNIWLGTEGSGLDKLLLDEELQTVELVNYNSSEMPDKNISHNIITCLFRDKNNRLWVGTHGGGVNLYDQKQNRFINISKADGLPSNLIFSIEEDQKGKLWISTNKGLVCYDPKTGTSDKFDVADGLQALEFTPRASYKKKDGELLFGGINGFNRFFPEKINPIPLYGPLQITDFQITGLKETTEESPFADLNILNASSIELAHDQNDFTISFSYLNFTQAAKNNYQYKLEGYDQEWQHIGTRNTAFYTNVPPGKYTFRVRAANSDLRWSEQEAHLGISVKSPWYNSIWAYGLYTLFIGAFLIWRKNSIIHREQLKNKLQLENMELKKLKELDEMKSRFFANISHEFRTPLTLILSPLKSLYYDEKWQEEKPRIKSMIHQADRLLSLINQILDLSKLEAGAVKLEVRKVELISFLKPLIFSFTGFAEKQYIKYRVSLPPEPVEVYIDPDKMEKIVMNLLSNAFKFTPQFGEVSFLLKIQKEKIQITITDSGEGIAEEELSHIFTRFYQGKKSNTRNKLVGSGIGLALTKELVELHNGKIEVESGQSTGTSLIVHIPLQPAVSGSPDWEKDHSPLTASPTVLPDFLKNAAQAHLEEGKQTERKETLLIAEDNEEIRAFLRKFLDKEFNILEATDGAKAYELALEQKPDLVITDVVMSQLDGFELCKKLKENEVTNYLPTIILTARASSESIEEGYALGADYYITKPFDPNHLRLQIKNILKARHHYKTKILHGNNHKITPRQVEEINADEAFMKQVMNIIETNIAEVNFNINDLCKEIGISRMQLYRKLKANISMSANELIRHVRLQRAAQLIKQEQHSISEITYMVGFTDLQYFRSCFKKQFGINPSEYQQQAARKKKKNTDS